MQPFIIKDIIIRFPTECPICFYELEEGSFAVAHEVQPNGAAATIQHIFHRACLLEQNPTNDCPICREPYVWTDLTLAAEAPLPKTPEAKATLPEIPSTEAPKAEAPLPEDPPFLPSSLDRSIRSFLLRGRVVEIFHQLAPFADPVAWFREGEMEALQERVLLTSTEQRRFENGYTERRLTVEDQHYYLLYNRHNQVISYFHESFGHRSHSSQSLGSFYMCYENRPRASHHPLATRIRDTSS